MLLFFLGNYFNCCLKLSPFFVFFRSWDAFLKLYMTICVLSELPGTHPKAMKISGNIWNMPKNWEEASS